MTVAQLREKILELPRPERLKLVDVIHGSLEADQLATETCGKADRSRIDTSHGRWQTAQPLELEEGASLSQAILDERAENLSGLG